MFQMNSTMLALQLNLKILFNSMTIDLLTIQCQAHSHWSMALAHNDAIPDPPVTPWTAYTLNSETNDANKKSFYAHVCANVVATMLENFLDPKTYETLKLKNHLYTFVDTDRNEKQDSPTMLYLLLLKMDPSTSISIESYCMQTEISKLQDFDINVPDMIAFIKKHYQEA